MDAPRSTSLDPDHDEAPSPENNNLTDDRRRIKRDRDAAYGPPTPKDEGDESKVVGTLTPLAKKGRVQPDSVSKDSRSTSGVGAGGSDEDEPPTGLKATTPPPSTTVALGSAPSTPNIQGRSLPEGRETKNIRQRVEALEWEDEEGRIVKEKDMEADSEEDPEKGVKIAFEPSSNKDVEFAEVAAEVSQSAELLSHEDAKEVKTTQEVAESAAMVDKPMASIEDSKARVADEVGESAILVDKQEEQRVVATEEVGDSAEMLAQEDEKEAEVAAEVAESSKVVEPEAPTAPAPKATPDAPSASTSTSSGFTSFSSTASPFSAFSGASPFASVAKTPTPKPSSFASPTPAPSTPTPKTPLASTSTSASEPSFGTSSTPSTSKAPVPPATPATPFGKLSLMKDSPFAAFSAGSTAVNGAGSGFGSYSKGAAAASPFASISKDKVEKEGEEDKSRKLGEPVEEDESKKIYTEQEVVTGEEDDDMVHSVRSKLFVMSGGAWVERGTGVLKLNITRDAQRRGARLVMRADATHRLLLNATLFPKFSIEVSNEKYVRFAIIEGNEPISYMLRLSGAPSAQALVKAVSDQIALLPHPSS